MVVLFCPLLRMMIISYIYMISDVCATHKLKMDILNIIVLLSYRMEKYNFLYYLFIFFIKHTQLLLF